MQNEHTSQTRPTGRPVVPELGSRYRPRQVRTGLVNDVRRAAPAPVRSKQPTHTPAQVVPSRPTKPDVTAPHPARKVVTSKPAMPRQHKSLVLKRTIIAKAEQRQKQARVSRRQQFKAFALGGVLAVVVSVTGMTFVLNNRRHVQQVDPSPKAAILGDSTEYSTGPDERLVSMNAVSTYQVAGDKPRVLSVKRLGLQARVVEVSKSQNGELEPTANIHDLGWLASSAKPGEPGATVLNGYVSGPTGAGALSGVAGMQVGDELQLERGDGKFFVYVVTKVQQYSADKVDLPAVMSSSAAGKSALNILTNTGRFNVRTNQFEDRTAVWAVLK